MRVLATFPGRFGDLIWALPTVRAISETYGQPVDLQIPAEYGSIAPLLRRQAYLETVIVDPEWVVQQSAPISPRTPPYFTSQGYERVFHLGFEGWPSLPLPFEIERIARAQADELCVAPIDLARPWITPIWSTGPSDLVIGFTDEWFELKYGLYWLLRNHVLSPRQPDRRLVGVSTSPRWIGEAGHSATSWEAAAGWLGGTRVFVGCCSALHVLACAIGKPVVLLEPNPHRHHPIFYPFGTEGPQVQLVRGIDGAPTHDARHLIDTIEAALAVRDDESSSSLDEEAPACPD